MPRTPSDEDLHEPHEKHVQLGYDPKAAGPAGDGDDLADEDRDAVWADACTVDEYKAALEALKTEPAEVVEELRRDREAR